MNKMARLFMFAAVVASSAAGAGPSDHHYGYWVFGNDMTNVNHAAMAETGATDLFLSSSAVNLQGKDAVETWIADASGKGIAVHIYMPAFYDGDWVNPVKNGAPDTALFGKIVDEAKSYAQISGVAGISFDYMRYPGNAYATSGGTAAISAFAKQAADSLHELNPDLVVSAVLMPETTDNIYYYGQDCQAIGSSMDVVIPAIYKGNYNAGTAWIDATTRWYAANSGGADVWVSLQGYVSDDNPIKLSASELQSDIGSAVAAGSGGAMVFRWGLSPAVKFKPPRPLSRMSSPFRANRGTERSRSRSTSRTPRRPRAPTGTSRTSPSWRRTT